MFWVRCGSRFVLNLQYVAFTEELGLDGGAASRLRVGLATGTILELTNQEGMPLRQALAMLAPRAPKARRGEAAKEGSPSRKKPNE